LIRKIYRLQESVLGVDFSIVIPVSELELDDAKVFRGSSSRSVELFNALNKLNVSKDDSILDIGCAKGGAIYTMYNFPFCRIDGIEISKLLASIAHKNLLKLGCDRTEIFSTNAELFEGYEKYSFFYLYNPFDDITLNRVLAKITSVNASFKLTYLNPTGHECVLKHGLKKCDEFPGIYGHKIYTYTFG
jgi:SAM-dependent methyltransferase